MDSVSAAPDALASIHSRWSAAVLVFLLVTLIARIVGAEFVVRKVREGLPDTELYHAYASRLHEGKTYEAAGRKALRTPGYPAFVALCWTLAGQPSSRAVLYAQALIGTLTVAIIYTMGRWMEQRGAPKGSAFAAMLAVSVEPFGLLLTWLELSETLATLLLVSSAYLILYATDSRSIVSAFFAGFLGALHVLVRPSGLALAVVSLMIAALFSLGSFSSRGEKFPYHPSRSRVAPIAWALLGFLLPMSPWWIRNAYEFHTLVLTTTNVGESLYDGLNPRADGSSRFWFKEDEFVAPREELAEDRYWRNQAIAWAQTHVKEVVELTAIKWRRFWSLWPNEARFQRWTVVVGTSTITLLLYAGAVVGIINYGTKKPLLPALLVGCLPILVFCILHLIFVSSVRYRAVAMPLVALWSGCGWAYARQLVFRHHSREE